MNKIKKKIISWTGHHHAPYYLAVLSFIEAFFFPIPPDLLLAPMALSKPNYAWWYATITTCCSVLGGVLGYFLGTFFFHLLEPYLVLLGYATAFHRVQHWFLVWGVWALFCAGFSPIPYKIFALSSGATGLPLLPFIIASCVARGSRFYLVSGLMRLGGEKAKERLKKCRYWLGGGLIMVIIASFIIYFCLS